MQYWRTWGVILLAAFALAPRAEAIELGGKQIPRERFVVYLLIGHSNMAGRDSRRADSEPHPRCWNYRWYADEQWVPAVETRYGNRGLTPRGSGGPGMAWLKLLAQKYENYHFGVILVANPAANAAPGGNSFSKGCDRYEELIRAAKAVQNEVTFGGLVAQLGICDRRRQEHAMAFAENMCRIVQDVRSDLGEPKLPFLIGQYEMNSTGGYDPRGGWAPEIIRQTLAIPKRIENAAIIDSVGIPCIDDHHYTFEGHALWCKRGLEILARNKWFPPPGAWRPTTRPVWKPLPPYVPPPEPKEWPATRNGLIFLWQNAKAENVVIDPHRARPRPCRLGPIGRAVPGPSFEMDVSGGAFIAQDADDEVVFNACRKTAQLTLEATIFPDEPEQDEAYIITFVPETGPPNFALLQHEDYLYLKLKAGVATVAEPMTVRLGPLPPGRPRHVLVSFVGGLLTCYVDGRAVATRRDVKGDFRIWTPGRLVFGDTWQGGHDWRGRIEGVALYNRHVGSSLAERKSKLYREVVRAREPIPRIRIEGRLTARSTPAEHTGVYGRTLILHRYAVRNVLAGACEQPEVQVLHWAGLDSKPVEEVLGRRVGQVCDLTLEPAERHPQLATEKIGADAEDIDLPRYYDAARPLPPLIRAGN
ncbi:MAG TPA: sialate O-acetylesterase [Phycisphaerae bacterium]|nr:sialate O-acetylesterase [Phycisphaerae bacterium]